MKCPKCGAGMNKWVHGWLCTNPHCVYDIQDENVTKEYIEKERLQHQQRLDKVLSKFEDDGLALCLKLKNHVELYYYEQDKSFNIMYDEDDIINNLSLDTVEALLRDLEAQDV